MLYLNIYEAKTHLSRYLERLSLGERVILCKRNLPIAEIRPLSKPITQKRPIGLAKGEFKVSGAFFEPLPSDLLSAFEG
ncbi:type II toxin-antitoxin system Phd/YefM family antitoxin [Candidatus Thiothrix anitrata]|jgi:antitoxin (DNA-binding transcriptional repressor) of toxin-antitoxin stability system|uniref:Type II toxin-antitoxin system Phd/YefM family antitoxin n=1 Tax=Candidatus Thiothrix anitrata TaxID=2823902 RepID=A0ABX7X8U7_9GAMM|nr:type II toxin-antitoxin system Phd/YefM family antitoxin [Candidatus Thiothrix anitrata]QTR51639.1 type II toxin-antitoxin system Phd/YefM family antitoxin [Candidatus Thiothrix anitrata]